MQYKNTPSDVGYIDTRYRVPRVMVISKFTGKTFRIS